MDTLVNKHTITNGIFKFDGYNGSVIGYEMYERDLNWKSHIINGRVIGCTKFDNSQYYSKTPGIKFGEEIKWK